MKRLFTVYAIRISGDCEARYIGQTSLSPEKRLSAHFGEAHPSGWASRTPFDEWLIGHRDEIEAIPLATFGSRLEAKAFERQLICALAKLGNRLFNRDHMPRELKPKMVRSPIKQGSIAA